MPGVMTNVPKSIGSVAYLLVCTMEFVPGAGGVELSLPLQPVRTAEATIPNSAKRTIIRFIGGLKFHKIPVWDK
jgi:hypothetical protein